MPGVHPSLVLQPGHTALSGVYLWRLPWQRQQLLRRTELQTVLYGSTQFKVVQIAVEATRPGV